MSIKELDIRRLEDRTASLAQQLTRQYDILQEMLVRQKVRDNTHKVQNIDMTITRTSAPFRVDKLFNGIPAHSMKFVSVSGTFQYHIGGSDEQILTASTGDTFVD